MQYGGFVTNFDANGKPVEMPEKCLNTQCTMIWWFSQLNMMVGGIVAHQSAIKIRGMAEHSTIQALNNQSERDAFGELLC